MMLLIMIMTVMMMMMVKSITNLKRPKIPQRPFIPRRRPQLGLQDPFMKILEANRERISTKIPGQARGRLLLGNIRGGGAPGTLFWVPCGKDPILYS